ncbi:MAG: 4Fe-4S double cluster binding domain-containing protein [Pseudomonadota bacterium]
MRETLTREIKASALSLGADMVGIADVALMEGLPTIPYDLLAPYRFAVSLAVALPRAVFSIIDTAPTPEYSAIYQTVNRQLDDIAVGIARWLDRKGFAALPVPASQVLDRETWHAAVSHKAVARMAGLGWQGKNLLLITPQYGSRVRLVTVLTNAPLTPDGPVKNRCGKCFRCRDACPVGAIRGVNTDAHYDTRNQAMFFSRCVEKLTLDFAKRDNIGAPICGICIRACPFTMKGKRLHRPPQ